LNVLLRYAREDLMIDNNADSSVSKNSEEPGNIMSAHSSFIA